MHHNETILIVDDHVSVRETIKGLLSTEDYNLSFAASGLEALDSIEKIQPDTILLDVMMPEMDGFEVCRRLKDSEQWRHIPIILVTGLDSQDDLVRGFEAGADDFLHKPVDGIELRARVRSMLRIKKNFDEVKASLQLREDLAEMVVHDMRTPLTIIQGFTELLLKSNIGPEYVNDIEQIYQQSYRLQAFIDDLLILAKVKHGQPILRRSVVDIKRLVRTVEQSHRPIAKLNDIEFIVELPTVSRKTFIDRNLFQRVLDNLISNALKFSLPESTVILSLEHCAPAGSRIQISDEGPGIPVEERERIFDKFEIVKMNQNGIPQVGIGLAFCKLVIEAHGGFISVEANKPRGSIFTVEI